MFYKCSNCKGVYFITTVGPNAELKPICCSGKVKGAKLLPIRIIIHANDTSDLHNGGLRADLDSPEE